MKSCFKKFKRVWEKEISKIEKDVLDFRGVSILFDKFQIDCLALQMSMSKHDFTPEMRLEIRLLESKLIRALEVARTRYVLQSKVINENSKQNNKYFHKNA